MKKVKLNNIGKYLVIIGIAILGSYYVYTNCLDKRANDSVDDYIEDTSQVEVVEEEIVEPIVEEKKEEKKENNINYKAVLEIPSINLKKGVVDSTKNFNSINYAISVDKHSNYPDKYGNFILYAHSGNSSIAFFRKLVNVNLKDDIYVYYNGIKYHYVVIDKYDIEKTGKAKVKSSEDNNYITLISCDQNRKGYQVIVIGKMVDKINY